MRKQRMGTAAQRGTEGRKKKRNGRKQINTLVKK